jgi:hypothetical protein
MQNGTDNSRQLASCFALHEAVTDFTHEINRKRVLNIWVFLIRYSEFKQDSQQNLFFTIQKEITIEIRQYLRPWEPSSK